jgi:hypothetical protein
MYPVFQLFQVVAALPMALSSTLAHMVIGGLPQAMQIIPGFVS